MTNMERTRQIERAAQKTEFLARGRDSLEHMARTGISYSVEDVSKFLTDKIEARRAELLSTSFQKFAHVFF
jgi:hypothetical protein